MPVSAYFDGFYASFSCEIIQYSTGLGKSYPNINKLEERIRLSCASLLKGFALLKVLAIPEVASEILVRRKYYSLFFYYSGYKLVYSE